MAEPVPSLYSLGAAPFFFGFLSILRGTIGLRTRHDYPECSNQYWEFRQSQTNCRSIHTQDAYHHNNMDRRLKIKVFMTGLEKESLIRIGLIMKRKALKEDICGRKASGA